KEIADSAYRFQQAVDQRERLIVGVNEQVQADEPPIEILQIDETAANAQMARLNDLRTRRNAAQVEKALDSLRAAARTSENLMPPILAAVRAYATLGEMCDALRVVYGEYEELATI